MLTISVFLRSRYTRSTDIYVAGQIEPSGLFISKPGQFVSTQVCLGQVQNSGHKSLFYQYRKYPKHSLKLTLGLIRPIKTKVFRPNISTCKHLGLFLY